MNKKDQWLSKTHNKPCKTFSCTNLIPKSLNIVTSNKIKNLHENKRVLVSINSPCISLYATHLQQLVIIQTQNFLTTCHVNTLSEERTTIFQYSKFCFVVGLNRCLLTISIGFTGSFRSILTSDSHFFVILKPPQFWRFNVISRF